MAQTVTIAEYAERRGVTVQAVHKAIRRYDIPVAGRPLSLDPRVADTLWATMATQRPNSGGAGPRVGDDVARVQGGDGVGEARLRKLQMDGLEAKTAKEIADAEIAQMKAATMRAALVDSDAVARTWFEIVRQIRDRMQAIPVRLAPQLAALTDYRDCQSVLDAEIARALAGISDAVAPAVAELDDDVDDDDGGPA